MASQRVEFVGGPLDGLTQELTHPAGSLPASTAIPVNPTLLRFLFIGGRQSQVRGAATSIAVYQLHGEDGAWQYRHFCSLAEHEYELQNA